MNGPSEIETRPVFEAEDFGEAMTPALADQVEIMRERLAGG